MTITIHTLNVTINLGGKTNPLEALLGSLQGIEVHHFERPTSEANPEQAPVSTSANTAPEQEPAAQDAPKPDLRVENLVAFLKSDDRFKLRTRSSIAKHFGVQEYDAALEAVLEDACIEGDVYTKRRRADGATLYGAY